MPKLSTIVKATRSVDVEFAGEKVSVSYFPAKYNSGLQSELRELRKRIETKLAKEEKLTPEEEEIGAAKLVRVLAGWDITDDDEKFLPCSLENLAALGYLWQWRLSKAIER